MCNAPIQAPIDGLIAVAPATRSEKTTPMP
jgi:hypothetical protein